MKIFDEVLFKAKVKYPSGNQSYICVRMKLNVWMDKDYLPILTSMEHELYRTPEN